MLERWYVLCNMVGPSLPEIPSMVAGIILEM